MADQAQGLAQTASTGAQEKVQGATGGVQGQIKGVTGGLLNKVKNAGDAVLGWGQGVLDRFFPPEQRAEFLAKIQAFMLANPKLSTFLGINLALTGVPLGLFVLFTLTVAIFSLIVGLIVGLLAAVFFTLLCVGLALAVVLPTVFFTTMAACFLFVWGLGGYFILKWVNGKGSSDPPPEGGQTIGDSLNSLTGGRLTGFMDAAKAEKAKGNITGFSDQHTKPKPPKNSQQQPNGSTHKQDVGEAVSSAVPVTSDVQKATHNTGIGNVQKRGANVTGTVKGGLGGATGLA